MKRITVIIDKKGLSNGGCFSSSWCMATLSPRVCQGKRHAAMMWSLIMSGRCHHLTLVDLTLSGVIGKICELSCVVLIYFL
jgi:hypothetical protein